MTVAEMAAWLLSLPDQGATVETFVHDSNPRDSYYLQGGTVSKEVFDPEKHSEYSDLRGNQFIKPDAPYYNQRTLFIGGEE